MKEQRGSLGAARAWWLRFVSFHACLHHVQGCQDGSPLKRATLCAYPGARSSVETVNVTSEPFPTDSPATGDEPITTPGGTVSEGSSTTPARSSMAFNFPAAAWSSRPAAAGTATCGALVPLEITSEMTVPRDAISPERGFWANTWLVMTSLSTVVTVVPNRLSRRLVACWSDRPTTFGTWALEWPSGLRTVDRPCEPIAMVRMTVEPRGLLWPGEGDWAKTRPSSPWEAFRPWIAAVKPWASRIATALDAPWPTTLGIRA